LDFVGRVDPVSKLKAWLAGEGTRKPLSIASVSGPGGIGKTFLLEHAIASAGIENRNYLRLRIDGTAGPRTLGQIMCHDLLQSTSQIDADAKAYFEETRKNLEALHFIDEQALVEVEVAFAGNTELCQTALEIFRLGAGLQSVLPVLRKYVDLTRLKEEHVVAIVAFLEKTHAYRQEKRVLGGVLPDLRGKGRRNRLRAGIPGAIADGLVADLSAIFLHPETGEEEGRAGRAAPPLPRERLDRLLLVIDDYESLAETLTPFLGDHFVPKLARAGFETLLVVLGRDRLSDTNPVWKQHHDSLIVGELRLKSLSREEGEAFVRASGVADDATVARILDETACYPYLLASEVEAELDGGRTALGLKNFYDRTTRWMNATEKGWLVPLCFLDDINVETIATVLPGEDPIKVLAWFKSESSVRSPAATKWEVLPIIRSRLCAYCKLDSPKRFRELEGLAHAAKAAGNGEGS
jgi:hypothetical protein